jgi:hypothetical protein
MIAEMWRGETAEVKDKYKKLAQEAKKKYLERKAQLVSRLPDALPVSPRKLSSASNSSSDSSSTASSRDSRSSGQKRSSSFEQEVSLADKVNYLELDERAAKRVNLDQPLPLPKGKKQTESWIMDWLEQVSK